MKLRGIFGKGKGKVGESVFSVNHGTQIVSQHNPIVTNPNTSAQVGQRAKFKLLSQLSAIFGRVIVMPRNGIMSPRNRFTSINMPFVYYSGANVQVSYENLQLTDSALALPFVVLRHMNSKIYVGLGYYAPKQVSRIVYILYRKLVTGELLYHASKVVEFDGEDRLFSTTFDAVEEDIICYAYGIVLANKQAEAVFGSYNVATGIDVAKLILSRKLVASDYQLTHTRGTTLYSGVDVSRAPQDGYVPVFITINGIGTVNWAGAASGFTYIRLGDTLVADAKEIRGAGFEFDGWYKQGYQTPITNTYHIETVVNEQLDLVANFVLAD